MSRRSNKSEEVPFIDDKSCDTCGLSPQTYASAVYDWNLSDYLLFSASVLIVLFVAVWIPILIGLWSMGVHWDKSMLFTTYWGYCAYASLICLVFITAVTQRSNWIDYHWSVKILAALTLLVISGSWGFCAYTFRWELYRAQDFDDAIRAAQCAACNGSSVISHF